MESTIFNLAPSSLTHLPVDIKVSFKAYLRHLQNNITTSGGLKSKIYRFISKKLQQAPRLLQPIDDIALLADYPEGLGLVESTVFPLAEAEENEPFALCKPMSPEIFYISTGLRRLMQPEDGTTMGLSINSATFRFFDARKEWLLYQFLLERLYSLPASQNREMVFPLFDEQSGLTKYFRIDPNLSFVDITFDGNLPYLPQELLTTGNGTDEWLEAIRAKLPLDRIHLEGFTILHFKEVTELQAVENLKNLVVGSSELTAPEVFDNLRESLQTLLGSALIKIGMIPLVKVNDQYVVEPDHASRSIIKHNCKSLEHASKMYEDLLPGTGLFNKPLIWCRLPDSNLHPFVNILRLSNIESYLALPIRFNDKAVGILEMGAPVEGILHPSLLTRLEPALPLLAQMLDGYISRFDARLEQVIRDKFTSLQPVVEWRFKEVAWEFMQMQDKGEKNDVGKVIFSDVYPYYGAVDVRNSTEERNKAVVADHKEQLEQLSVLWPKLKKQIKLSLLDELIFKTDRWKLKLQHPLTAEEEVQIALFFDSEIREFLQHFRQHSNEAIRQPVEHYFSCLDYETGCIYEHRRRFEQALQTINRSLARYLEAERDTLQQSYPNYFEKYRTDGIEYSIYIGQSLCPGMPFDELYLRNLRLWQVQSMAQIAHTTYALIPSLPVPLQTTQLILAHHLPIDISFRRDERRFDVEGAYNIRYEIMKKRIDKVRIRSTGERLVQPGKIAIVYTNNKEAEEYQKYIHYLQEKGRLHPDLELLELEETQGFLGLKALRVGVVVE